MKFMHIADIHLGYQQYGLKERFNDFSKTYLFLAKKAVEEKVDFVLLAGDLFHKRTVEPLAMRAAIEGLKKLQKSKIPVLAVEGNHEKPFYKAQTSWLDFLDAMGYIQLLSPRYKGGKAELSPYGDSGGAYVDLPSGVRVYGLKYYGASTSKAIQSFTEALQSLDQEGVNYSILMMHAGLEGQLAYTGRLKHNDLAPLKKYIDYVALGHIHKPYTVEDWIYNPGSPETCSMEEAAWPERGYYIVSFDPDSKQKHEAQLRAPERRPFHRFHLKVDNLQSPNVVYDAVKNLVDREQKTVSPGSNPVIRLTLEGILPFNRYELDLDYIKTQLEEAWSPLTARVHSRITPAEFEITANQQGTRSELEQEVVRELVERDHRFRQQSEAWAKGALDLKRLVLEGSAPDEIIDHLAQLQSELFAEEE